MNQVFLSQLHRRARLLNTSFQQFVAAVVCQHSSTQSSALNDTGGDGSNQLKLTPAQQTLLSGFWDSKASAATAAAGPQVFTCLFTDGQRAQVHVQSAPVKTLARMREKLTKYVFPSPIPRLFSHLIFFFERHHFTHLLNLQVQLFKSKVGNKFDCMTGMLNLIQLLNGHYQLIFLTLSEPL